MAFSNFIGIVLGFLVIFLTITMHSANGSAFLSTEGAMLVMGGTFAYALMSFPGRLVLQAMKAIVHMVTKPVHGPETLKDDIQRFVSWGYFIHSKGMKEFERKVAEKLMDPELRYGADLLVSGYNAEDVRRLMETAAETAFERNTRPTAVLQNMAGSAPAFGMVGTLVGMVVMLANFESDMSKVGSGMAIAMIATFYGLVMARLVFMPAANNLNIKQEQVRFRNYLLAEGFALLAEKRTASFVQDALDSYMDPVHHQDLTHLRQRKNEPVL
ncbi:MAG: flagellar motor protein MotA [Proteobacteria bacterium]|nr:flagellar motor protein MotA [Pseudomonadota bacterium]